MTCAGWIRFRASLMAMRRISWIDQRISGGVGVLWLLPGGGVLFFWAVADWRDGGSPPSWRRRASPGRRGDASHARTCFRCDRARIRFRGFETVLDRPPMAFDRHQRFDGRSRWTPGGEEGEIAISDMPTDQQTARPQTLICSVGFVDLEIGQFEITPVMQPRSFGSGSRRQSLPVGRAPRPGDVFGLAGDRLSLAPGSEDMRAADTEHIAFACPP